MSALLAPGMCLTLRPMRYPEFYERYRDAIRNTWTVEEVDLAGDLSDLASLGPQERHLVHRLIAFFATGDSLVANNLVLSFYRHLNAAEARMYLSRQLFEEAQHVQFYLTLLDTYVPDPADRAAAFDAVRTIPSIRRKAEFCLRWMDSATDLDHLETERDRRRFLLNLICFAACVEGMFFFSAFAYVYFLRSRGLLHGLAAGTNWVFRDESGHMEFAFAAIAIIRTEEPGLFDGELELAVVDMLREAIACELEFARDLLGPGITGLSLADVERYLQYIADQRLRALGLEKQFGTANPFGFLDLQDVQEVTNFFERRASAYQLAIAGELTFDAEF